MNRSAVVAVLIVIVVAVGGVLAYSYLTPGSGGQGGASGQQTTPSSSSQPAAQSSTQPGASGGSGGQTGTLNFYLTDAPPKNSTLKYLLLNVTSLELRYEGVVGASSTSTSASSSRTNSSQTSTGTRTNSSGSVTGRNATTLPRNVFSFQVPPSTGTNLNLTRLQGQALLLGATKVPAGNVTAIVLHITGARAYFTDGTSTVLKVVANGKLMIPFRFGVQANGSTDLTIDIQPNDIHVSQGTASVLTPVIHVLAVEKGQSGTRTSTNSTTFTTSTTTTTSSNSTTSST